jgi:hypothetical protein
MAEPGIAGTHSTIELGYQEYCDVTFDYIADVRW